MKETSLNVWILTASRSWFMERAPWESRVRTRRVEPRSRRARRTRGARVALARDSPSATERTRNSTRVWSQARRRSLRCDSPVKNRERCSFVDARPAAIGPSVTELIRRWRKRRTLKFNFSKIIRFLNLNIYAFALLNKIFKLLIKHHFSIHFRLYRYK